MHRLALCLLCAGCRGSLVAVHPHPRLAARLSRPPLATATPDDQRHDPPDRLRVLDRPLPQAALCLTGYLVHVTTLSRRSVRVGGLEAGWDTLVGVAVLFAAMWKRTCAGSPAVPGWLSSDTPDAEANGCADFSEASAKQKLKLLATGGLLLVTPLLFTTIQPALDAVVYVLAIFVPLTEASLLGARLLFEQTVLYVLLCKLIQRRHPDFFGSKVKPCVAFTFG